MAESYPRIAQVVLDTTDGRTLAEFYRELFGLEYRAGDEPPAPNQTDPWGSDWLGTRTADHSWRSSRPTASDPRLGPTLACRRCSTWTR